MSKKIPRFRTDEEAEQFLEQDLTDYLDPKNFVPVTFELLPKTKQVNLRFSVALLDAVRKQARQEGISYQKFVRRAVEESLNKSNAKSQ